MKIIRIHAIWCPACLVMQKSWEHLKELYKKIEFISYDYDMDEEAMHYNPGTKLPVYIFIKDDREVGRLIGEKKETDFIEMIGKNL